MTDFNDDDWHNYDDEDEDEIVHEMKSSTISKVVVEE